MPRSPKCAHIPASWLGEGGVLSYILDCYHGKEKVPGRTGPARRVFHWKEKEVEIAGNAEAFLIHMCEKFGLQLKPTSTYMIHSVLRESGQTVTRHKLDRGRPSKHGPHVGKFRQPDPKQWEARSGKR